jgi:hypothetical protein
MEEWVIKAYVQPAKLQEPLLVQLRMWEMKLLALEEELHPHSYLLLPQVLHPRGAVLPPTLQDKLIVSFPYSFVALFQSMTSRKVQRVCKKQRLVQIVYKGKQKRHSQNQSI